jgi:TonB-linked SusC/RagA family outer membrane protein
MRILLLITLISVVLCSTAQSQTISGRITNAKGEPVSFATVRVKGKKTSVAANEDGSFKISATKGQTLVITAANYANNEQLVSTDDMMVTLKLKDAALTEVVVTALGQSQNKAKIGYSTASFSTAEINKNGAVGMLDGLAGKVAGADISNTGGPGQSTKVVLRGYGVIAGGNNQPLYVVDGVPLSDAQFQNNSNLASAGNVLTNQQDFGNAMNDINPNDIETITILKGTAASSLYGGLAKNGVILITTKKGRAGKIKIDFSSSANISSVGKLPTYQSEFGQGWAGVFVLDENGAWGPKLDGKERLWGSEVDGQQLEKPFSYQKDGLRAFYDIGNELNNSLSISGGNDVNRFYFSYGNVNSSGIVPNQQDYLQRNTFSFRTNNTYNRFAINTSLNYVNRKLTIPSTGQSGADGGGVFQSILQIPVDLPIKDFRDINNKFFNINNYFTPYAENPYYGLYEDGNVQNSDRLFGNVDMNYKFNSHFNTEFRIGGDFTNARTKTWKQVASPAPGSWNAGANPEGASKTADVGSVTQASDFFGIINADFIVKYTQDLSKDFSLDVFAGANYYQNSQRSEATGVTNLSVPSFFNLSNTSLTPITNDFNLLQRRIGLYGQATLAFANQLYLTGDIRNDWSSTLPINNNSIFYPGANLSWIASQDFSAKNIISYLKFRLAYGQTGSDPAPYLVYPSLGSGAVGLQFGSLNSPFNGVNAYGINNTIGNPALKPILADEFEFGTEVRFFNDRIGIDATIYDKEDKGQIFPVTIAPSTGYTNLVENLGLISNKGIELTVNAIPVKGRDFTWTLGYTYARNWNNVDQLTGATQNPIIFSISTGAEERAVVGKTVASIYAPGPQYTPNGQIVVDATTGYPVVNQTPDKNGLTNHYFGSGLYNYTMGMTNSFTYKNLNLSFSLDLRYGGVMYSNTASLVLFVGNGIATTYNDRRPFIVPNSVNAVESGGNKTYVENTTYVGSQGSGQTDDTWGYYYPSQNAGSATGLSIFDRSFLKLRDVNLSYNLPRKWASKISATNASIGLYGRNFILWMPKSNLYVDPEATNLSNDLAGQLGEFASAPLAKFYGAILRITF